MASKFKKNLANKNFNFVILQRNFFILNDEKHFDAYTIAIYFYLLNRLNENFYHNNVEISINQITKNLKFNKRTILSRIEILKENNLIFWESTSNKTYFYFGDLAIEKIEKEKIKIKKKKTNDDIKNDFLQKSNNSNLKLLLSLLSSDIVSSFKNYTTDLNININDKEKIIILNSNNSFIKRKIKKDYLNKIRSEILDYTIKLE